MSQTTQTRELPPLSLRAMFQPATVDDEKRTVELTWTTGARVLRGFWEPYWEELSLDPKHVRLGRLNNGAPFLRDHGSMWSGPSIDDVLAVVERAWLMKDEGRALVRFPRVEDDEEADKVFRKIKAGILQNVSVGYRIHKMEKVEDGEGQTPVMRAIDWEPFEISAVAIGADDGAGFRSESRSAVLNRVEIITRGEAPQKEQEMPNETTTPAPTDTSRAAPSTPPAVPAPTDTEQVRAAERERCKFINDQVTRHSLPAELGRKLIDGGGTIDAARAAILDALVERSDATGPSQTAHAVRVTGGEDEKDKRRGQQVAWLLHRANAIELIERARKHPVHGHQLRDLVLDPGEARGMSFPDMARDFLREHKVNVRGMTSMEVAGRALSLRSGYQGTDTFPVVFEQALSKILLAAYLTQSDTWRLFCGTDSVPDFRPSNRYRMGEMGTLDVVPENAEYTHKSIPDGSKVQISTETRGNLISLSRQAIVNDDMGALADTAAKFGRMAGRTIEVNVYALLAQNGGLGPTMSDGNPFFHSSRGNVGTGAALSVSSINADKVLMRRQKDLNGQDYLDINPGVLLLPDSLEADAKVYNDAQYDPADNKFQKPNTVRGLFSRVIGSPRLSGTRRYMFADPASGVVAIKVVYLEGQGELPFMDSEEGFSVDGTTWKIRQDVKAVPFDPKGATTNAGA